MNELSADQRAAIEQLLSRGRKIEAIKRFREATGVGLAEAKRAVEAMHAASPVAQSPPPATPIVETSHGCASAVVVGAAGVLVSLLLR